MNIHYYSFEQNLPFKHSRYLYFMKLLGTKVCKKHDLGVHNNLFGGVMLSWVDELAVAFVNEICHSPNMVTLKMEEVLFCEGEQLDQVLRPNRPHRIQEHYGDFGSSEVQCLQP